MEIAASKCNGSRDQHLVAPSTFTLRGRWLDDTWLFKQTWHHTICHSVYAAPSQTKQANHTIYPVSCSCRAKRCRPDSRKGWTLRWVLGTGQGSRSFAVSRKPHHQMAPWFLLCGEPEERGYSITNALTNAAIWEPLTAQRNTCGWDLEAMPSAGRFWIAASSKHGTGSLRARERRPRTNNWTTFPRSCPGRAAELIRSLFSPGLRHLPHQILLFSTDA